VRLSRLLRRAAGLAEAQQLEAGKRPRGKRVSARNQQIDRTMSGLKGNGLSDNEAAQVTVGWLRMTGADPFPPEKYDDPVGTVLERQKQARKRTRRR